MAARRSRLTPKVQEAIITSLKCGASYTGACAAAGIPRDTGLEWLARGEGRDKRPPTPQFKAFAEACREAEGVAEDDAIKIVRVAMRKNWQAAAWYLERVHAERYGNRIKQEHTFEKVDLTKLSTAELEKIASGDFTPIAGAGTA